MHPLNKAAKAERVEYLGAQPYERTETQPKTMLTRFGNITFQVFKVRFGDFYPSALIKGTRTDQAVNLALAEMYVQGVSPAGSSRCCKHWPGQTCNCSTPRSAAPPRNWMPASNLRCAWRAASMIAPC